MYDLLIRNGLVVDGTGAPGRRATPASPAAAPAVRALGGGRALVGGGGGPRRDFENKKSSWRSDGCRRLRLLQPPAQPAHGLPGAPARLPQREPRGAQGV